MHPMSVFILIYIIICRQSNLCSLIFTADELVALSPATTSVRDGIDYDVCGITRSGDRTACRC